MGKRSSLIAAFILAAHSAAAECTDAHVSLKGDWGKAQFSIDIADDAAERSQGLMHVEQMPRFTGMLFVYERSERVAFWMKNTLIPLDMIFIDSTGTVVKVHDRAQPGDLTAIPSDQPVQYVLEINGGMAEMLGISAGSSLQHPMIDQSQAIWPCES